MRRRIIQSILVIFCISLVINCAVAQEGKILRIRFHSPSLEKNLFNDSPDRDVTIYLPPSYDVDTDMRYPVVYLLHGYTGNDMLWTGGSYIRNGNIKDWMNIWLKEGKLKEMILVMPNSYNKFLGSWYTNSTTTGNWADYIAKDLVSYTDKKYRTLPQRESRGVIGHSMGGYGALKLGILYSDVFSCMGVLAGAYISEDFLIRNSGYHAFASTVENWDQFYSLNWRGQVPFSMAAVFAPNTNKPPFYGDFAFVYTNTQPIQIVKNQNAYDRYLNHDIHKLLETNLSTVLEMRAIYLDCGTSDELISEARSLREKLNKLGIKHIYKEFSGDHTCCVMNSTGDALEVFSKAMAFEMLTGVEPKGKLATTWGEIRRIK